MRKILYTTKYLLNTFFYLVWLFTMCTAFFAKDYDDLLFEYGMIGFVLFILLLHVIFYKMGKIRSCKESIIVYYFLLILPQLSMTIFAVSCIIKNGYLTFLNILGCCVIILICNIFLMIEVIFVKEENLY